MPPVQSHVRTTKSRNRQIVGPIRNLFRRKARGPNLRCNRSTAFLALLPLAVLLLDAIAYPVLFETRDSSSKFSGVQLIRTGMEYLGNFRAHRIYVCLDDISDTDYLSFLTEEAGGGLALWNRSRRRGNGLAVSIVRVGTGWSGSLLANVLRKLASLSGGDRDGIIDLLTKAASAPNDVLWYDLHYVPPQNRESFPIDRLLFLKLGEHRKEAYPGEIVELLNLAERGNLSNLVLPCLGRNPERSGKGWLSCGDTFAALFHGLKRGESPASIYLSLYKRWPDKTITTVAESLTANWQSTLNTEERTTGALPVLYQGDARLMLFFLAVCLLVCSSRIQLTPRNFVIICVIFVPAALGLEGMLAPLLRDITESIPVCVTKAVLLGFLSGGFLFFADLDVKGFLKPHHGKLAR
jgi:hypothetical protein